MKDIARRRGKRFLVQKHSSVSARTKCYYNIDSAHFCVIPDIDRLWSRHSCETGKGVDHSSELVTGKICGIEIFEHPALVLPVRCQVATHRHRARHVELRQERYRALRPGESRHGLTPSHLADPSSLLTPCLAGNLSAPPLLHNRSSRHGWI